MKLVMVSYKLKADRAEENIELIQAVFGQLERERPAGLGYASFRLPDGLSFVHIASIAGATNPLTALAQFKAFTANIRDRCEEPPVTAELDPVGHYRLFAHDA